MDTITNTRDKAKSSVPVEKVELECVEMQHTCTVKPAELNHASKSQQERLLGLCPCDLQLLHVHYNQKALIFRFPGSDLNLHRFQEVCASLKRGLALVLVHYYPLAGRLLITDDNAVFIDCSDHGADVVEAEASNISVADILSDDVPLAVYQLFSLNGALNIQGHHLPLLAVQVTWLKDGVALGFTMNHVVVDGSAHWHFTNSFAEICRGRSEISVPPEHTRDFFIQGLPPRRFQNLNKTIYSPSAFAPPVFREKFFYFSKETLTMLKKSANEGAYAKENGLDTEITSLPALCAHIWQAITRARALKGTKETEFKQSVNCRARKDPPLSPFYFGNAIQAVAAKATAEELLSKDISYAAGLLHHKTSSHQNTQIMEAVEAFQREPRLHELTLEGDGSSVWLGSSPRFPMYDADFGWGKPAGVRSGLANKWDGRVMAFADPHGNGNGNGNGGVQMGICLKAASMAALEADALFLFRR